MKTEFYVKLNDTYVLLDSATGSRSYIVWEDVKYYKRPKKYDGITTLMVYDTLEDARRALYTQFMFGKTIKDYKDGLGIERVTSKFFGLWKTRKILPAIGKESDDDAR